jgi:hypothetical protein
MRMNGGSPPEVPIGRREDARARLDLAARLVSVSGVQQVRLNNLSRGGASVWTPTPPKLGSDVIFQWQGIDAVCSVVWSAPDRCGLRFEEPVPDEAVLLARSLSDGRSARARSEAAESARKFVDGRLRVGYGDD